MEAHRMMVQDPMMAQKIEEKLEEDANAPQAVLKAAEEQAQMFEMMEDEYFAARAVDLRDVGKRVAKYILGVKEPELGDEKVILCGREIEPSVIAGMPTDKIAGVILGSGSTTAHAVIIAKARAIPTIVGLNKEDRIDKIADGDHVIMDGEEGKILVNPSEEELAGYNEKIKKQQELAAHYAQLKDLPAVTTDGVKVDLMANIGTHMDVDNALKYGAKGVGLFRSEFVFMGRQDIPNEEDQFKAYKEAVEKCQGNLCVIRTMDIGGDKPLPYLNIPEEENPFLGYRAVRISLQRKDLFLPQLKAILRADVYGKVGIMVPMIIPALVTVGILTFINSWGDFMSSLLYLNTPSRYTVAYALKLFSDSAGTDYGAIFAMSTLSLVPILVIFFFFQRQLVEGISTQGLKG
jgi:phosphotransferase system enzyme I (PtsI)